VQNLPQAQASELSNHPSVEFARIAERHLPPEMRRTIRHSLCPNTLDIPLVVGYRNVDVRGTVPIQLCKLFVRAHHTVIGLVVRPPRLIVCFDPMQKAECVHQGLVHDMLTTLVKPGIGFEAPWVLIRTIALGEGEWACCGYFAALRRRVSTIEVRRKGKYKYMVVTLLLEDGLEAVVRTHSLGSVGFARHAGISVHDACVRHGSLVW
jgi:hypothetical protein